MEPEHVLNQLEAWLTQAQTPTPELSSEASRGLISLRELQAKPRQPQALWLELLEILAELPGLPGALRQAIYDQLDSRARAIRLDRGTPDPQLVARLLGLVENHLTRIARAVDPPSEQHIVDWVGGAAEPSKGKGNLSTNADRATPSTATSDEKGAS